MSKNDKHHVFSARTTMEGLKVLNQLKSDLKLNWDELVLDAICAKYNLPKSTMVLPKTERQPKAERPKAEKKAKKAEKKVKKAKVTDAEEKADIRNKAELAKIKAEAETGG